MTLTTLLTMAREQYNAVSDSFFSDAELLRMTHAACQQLAMEALLLETTPTDTSVASNASYALPAYTIAVRRVTYDGKPLKKVDFRDDYAVSLANASVMVTGTPQFYHIWNGYLYLRPTPDTSALTIQYYNYSEHAPLVLVTDTLTIPTLFQDSLIDYIHSRMYGKDKDFSAAKYHMDLWKENGVLAAKRWAQKRKRADQFAGVHDEESTPVTILGIP